MTDEFVNPFVKDTVPPEEAVKEEEKAKLIQEAKLTDAQIAAQDAAIRLQEKENKLKANPPEGRGGIEVSEDPVKKACLEEIQKILAEHDNLESNIGIGHAYWDLVKLYRSM